ncbi:hypothetical protein D9757_008373 [Collybiopsis confluens]|uniref:Uncharacterized protein n=1 Tax=Collybiopsis confluens TaxID=2823264 RepID=A0A8H5HHA5_9AGAR|nr:hypothetical protein D9757_008373 [Collybiopsis confluens]
MCSQAPGMVAKSAGNATVLIDNATFAEQAVQPLEIIHSEQHPDSRYFEFLNFKSVAAITFGLAGRMVKAATAEKSFGPPLLLAAHAEKVKTVGSVVLGFSLAYAVGTLVINLVLIALIVCLLPVIDTLELLPVTAQTMGIAPTLIMVRMDLSASVESISTKEENV